MLWAVHHEWTSGAQFVFNCYCHWATLVVRDLEGSGHFFKSKEGVTQGEPLSMIAYGIGFLPIVQELRDKNPGITQPCYTDDTGAGLGTYFHTSSTFRSEGHRGPTSRNRPILSLL